jgi:hypothetical protein
MRRSIVAVAVCVAAAATPAARAFPIALEAENAVSECGTLLNSDSQITFNFEAIVNVGATLFVFVVTQGEPFNAPDQGMTDSNGHTYTADHSLLFDPGTEPGMRLFSYSTQVTTQLTAVDTVTWNYGASGAADGQVCMRAFAFNNIAPFPALDAVGDALVAPSSSAAWSATTDAATTQPNTLVLGVAAAHPATALDHGSTFPELEPDLLCSSVAGYTLCMAPVYSVANTTGVKSIGGTWTDLGANPSEQPWIAIIEAFRGTDVPVELQRFDVQ